MEIEARKKKSIKIVYNDDCAVLDYLADMADREPLHQLQRFIDWSDQKPHIILAKCVLDNVIVMILYKSPFDFNEKPNNLVLYIDSSLDSMIRYFKRFEELMEPRDPLFKKALDDILRLLYIRWAEEQDEDVSMNHIG